MPTDARINYNCWFSSKYFKLVFRWNIKNVGGLKYNFYNFFKIKYSWEILNRKWRVCMYNCIFSVNEYDLFWWMFIILNEKTNPTIKVVTFVSQYLKSML